MSSCCTLLFHLLDTTGLFIKFDGIIYPFLLPRLGLLSKFEETIYPSICFTSLPSILSPVASTVMGVVYPDGFIKPRFDISKFDLPYVDL